MNILRSAALGLALLATSTVACADDAPDKAAKPDAAKHEDAKPKKLEAKQSETEGSVTVDGRRIDYKAVAGTILLDNKKDEATASLFYAAYFRRGAEASRRPITFLYNGGPGSATIWLHMGAFGPKRVVTADDQHTAVGDVGDPPLLEDRHRRLVPLAVIPPEGNGRTF